LNQSAQRLSRAREGLPWVNPNQTLNAESVASDRYRRSTAKNLAHFPTEFLHQQFSKAAALQKRVRALKVEGHFKKSGKTGFGLFGDGGRDQGGWFSCLLAIEGGGNKILSVDLGSPSSAACGRQEPGFLFFPPGSICK
jgi:hypothetical protein